MEKLSTISKPDPNPLAGVSRALVAFQAALDRPFSGSAGTALRWLFCLAGGAIVLWSFLGPDAAMFDRPELARIFFWHFPCPMISSVLLMQGAWYAARYLRERDLRFDVKSAAALELGMVWGVLTMLSGIVFSKAQWGGWWESDPRQTSFAMVLMLYFAYFLLRGAFAERDQKAAFAGGYALAAILPELFLIFIFPRLPHIAEQSLHPSDTILSGKLMGSYAQIIWATVAFAAALTVWLFRLRVRAGLLELRSHGLLELEAARGDSAAPHMVRPVRVPPAD